MIYFTFDDGDRFYLYRDNQFKTLDSPFDSAEEMLDAITSGEQSVHLFASINEVFEEGSGWIGCRDFIRKHPNDSYKELFAPSISRVNANYLDVKAGTRGRNDAGVGSRVTDRDMRDRSNPKKNKYR